MTEISFAHDVPKRIGRRKLRFQCPLDWCKGSGPVVENQFACEKCGVLWPSCVACHHPLSYAEARLADMPVCWDCVRRRDRAELVKKCVCKQWREPSQDGTRCLRCLGPLKKKQ